jgi:DNA modification methylase
MPKRGHRISEDDNGLALAVGLRKQGRGDNVTKTTTAKVLPREEVHAIRNRIVETKQIRASELVDNPNNWRTHPAKQKAALLGAIEDLGQVQAVTVRKIKGGKYELFDGHLRKDVFGDEMITVNVTDLSEAEANKALLTLDPLAAMAGKNSEALTKLLSSTQFDNADLQKMLEQMGKSIANVGYTDPDAIPMKSGKSKIRRGDVFELGKHRLMCGDSTEDIPKLIGQEKPNLMTTDPPYGVNYDPTWRNHVKRANGSLVGAKRTGIVSNDDRADWTDVWKAFVGDVAYVWHGGLHSAEVERSLGVAGFEVRAQIIWAKTHHAISRGAYHWQHEPCWYAVRSGKKANWLGDRKQTTLWQVMSTNGFIAGKDEDSDGNHSTQKPVELFRRPMLNHTREMDAVLDPFCGSGSCIIAGEQTNRRVLAMELDPTYVEQAIRRWELFSGKKATLAK